MAWSSPILWDTGAFLKSGFCQLVRMPRLPTNQQAYQQKPSGPTSILLENCLTFA